MTCAVVVVWEGNAVAICPIARAVHCTGCFLVKICPAKTILGDYGKTESKVPKTSEPEDTEDVKTQEERSA